MDDQQNLDKNPIDDDNSPNTKADRALIENLVDNEAEELLDDSV